MRPLHLLTMTSLLLAFATTALPQQPEKKEAKAPEKKQGKAAEKKDDNRLPLSKLPPAQLIPDLCLVKYRVSTTSPECQAYFDQGLGYFYSYVWMEAARCFETATRHDPDCALAWWALSRSLERWGKPNVNETLKKAQELMPTASPRERLLITARLQEKGILPGAPAKPGQPVDVQDGRLRAATATIDEMLALYDDDEEGWYYRAQLAGGSG